jgi:hypothetical protein
MHTDPPLLLESTAAQPVLYTIGVVGFGTVLLMMGMMMPETC